MPQIESQQLFSSIEKSLKEEKFATLYCLFGEEPYLVGQAFTYLKTCALQGCSIDFNFTSFYSADADMSRVRDEVETLPMMSPRRVVVLKEIQDVTDKEWLLLEPVLANPVDSTVFILMGSKVDKRKKFYKLLVDKAVMTEFKKPYENQIPGWIRHIAKNFKLEISDEAVQLLHRLVGNHLLEIEAEIKKLVDYMDQRTEVTLEDVAQCVSKRREESVFALTERIAHGDRVRSIYQLVNLLENGQSEIGIVSLVARHMRILLLIKQGVDLGLSGQKLSSFAQVPHYFILEYLAQSKFWTRAKLESVLLLLSETFVRFIKIVLK